VRRVNGVVHQLPDLGGLDGWECVSRQACSTCVWIGKGLGAGRLLLSAVLPCT
jgi:hypothetical protein